jgi:DNA-binding transcriptional MerR regulator
VTYGVDDLARAAGLSVDTIRYYQTRGILQPPGRAGRRAVYDETHRERLGWIRDLTDRGYSLRSIEELVSAEGGAQDARLRTALEEEQSEAVYTRREFAAALEISPALLAAVERSGLASPQARSHGQLRYTESDVAAAKGARKLLDHGLPLPELLGLAVVHHRSVAKTVDRAIDLFDDHIRKQVDGSDGDGSDGEAPERVAEAYRDLLPVVTTLVAQHFQRVLVNRALERLRDSGSKRSWRTALKETARARLRFSWR